MVAKKTVGWLIAIAATWGLGLYLTRQKPAGAEELPPEDEEPFGTQFRNLNVIFYQDAFTPADNVKVTIYWDYKGEGGYFNDGVLVDASPTKNIIARDRYYAPSDDWKTIVKTFFAYIPTQLPPGSKVDVMGFVSKPEVAATFDNADQMELTRWYREILTVGG